MIMKQNEIPTSRYFMVDIHTKGGHINEGFVFYTREEAEDAAKAILKEGFTYTSRNRFNKETTTICPKESVDYVNISEMVQ